MSRELKGWHVLAIGIGAFAVVGGVNFVMAYQAISTFPGLEVANSYVASQTFEEERVAQNRLNWTTEADYEDGVLRLRITDRNGNPAPVKNLHAVVGRPTHVRDDQSPEFSYFSGAFLAPLRLAPGKWNIHLTAEAPDGTLYRQRLDHFTGSQVR